MKKFIGLVLVAFALVGCVRWPNYTYTPFSKYAVEAREEKTAGVGDTFFAFEEGQTVTEPTFAPKGGVYSGTKFDLTIVELNYEKLGLQYDEFFYQFPYVGFSGSWLLKEGFSKRFDYAVADKVIRFQGYEFEILGVEKGQLRYRRIK